METETFFENNYITTYMENEFLVAVYKPNLIIDLAVAKETVHARKKVGNGIDRLVYVDIRNLKSVTDEARDWLGTIEANQYIKAMAIHTNNPIQNLLANFYLMFSKPPMPTKLFTDKDKALRWLKLYTQQN
jgi:hypothetical protein